MAVPSSIHVFKDLYSESGIDLNHLGVVMLSIKPVKSLITMNPQLSADDLYVSEDPERFWIDGDIASSKVGHVTLMYGLLPGVSQDHIAEVMTGWGAPKYLIMPNIDIFPSPYPADDPDHGYSCIVARLDIDANPELAEAHQRLSYLPHVDTHPTFKPHVTLAYVRSDCAGVWSDSMNQAAQRGDLDFEIDTSVDPRGLVGASAKGQETADV